MFRSIIKVHSEFRVRSSEFRSSMFRVLEFGVSEYSILFVTSIHQTTNHVFPNFFHEFFSVLAVERENKLLFIGQKQSQFWTNEKFVFFFNCSNWEKFAEKIGENKIGCLVVWSHEQADTELGVGENLSKINKTKNISIFWISGW